MRVRFLLFTFACLSLAQAYDYDAHKNPITDKPLKLAVIPTESPYKKLTFTAVKVVEAEASRLKRFKVMSVQPVKKKKLLKQQLSPGLLKDLTQTTGADEALNVSILSFSDKKVKIKEAVTSKKPQKKHYGPLRSERRFKIRFMHSCSMDIMVSKIKLPGGEIASSKVFKKAAQMNTRREAVHYMFNSFRSDLRNYLRSIYIMESEIVKVEFDRLVLRLGRNMGIPENTIFKIRTRGRVEHAGEEELAFPGEAVALARVREVGENASVAYLIRQWDHINIDYQAVEMLSVPGVWRIQAHAAYPSRCLGGAIQYVFNPLGRWNFQLGLQLSRTEDSRKDGGLSGFGFETAATYRQPVARLFRLKPGLGYSLDVYRRDDDAGGSANCFLHSLPLILDSEWVLSKRWNLTAGLAWFLFASSNRWVIYDEGEEPVWNGSRPRVDISGLRLRLSLDYLWF